MSLVHDVPCLSCFALLFFVRRALTTRNKLRFLVQQSYLSTPRDATD